MFNLRLLRLCIEELYCFVVCTSVSPFNGSADVQYLGSELDAGSGCITEAGVNTIWSLVAHFFVPLYCRAAEYFRNNIS